MTAQGKVRCALTALPRFVPAGRFRAMFFFFAKILTAGLAKSAYRRKSRAHRHLPDIAVPPGRHTRNADPL